jgi:antitoxin MazE
MSRVTVGKWGKSLAIRVPLDVAKAAGLREGDAVDIESIDGGFQVRADHDREAARQRARAAVSKIRAAAKGARLGGLSIRDLRNEGRR